MAAAWMQDFTQGVVVARTRDGGRTWAQSIPPKLGECTGSPDGTTFDPRLAYGADGTLYPSTMRDLVLRPGRTTPDNEVAVSASPDGGRTRRDPVTVQPLDGYDDFPSVAADPDHPGRVYRTFSKKGEPIDHSLFTMFASSRDGGRTWTTPEDHPPRYRRRRPSRQRPRGRAARGAARPAGATWAAPVDVGEQGRDRTARIPGPATRPPRATRTSRLRTTAAGSCRGTTRTPAAAGSCSRAGAGTAAGRRRRGDRLEGPPDAVPECRRHAGRRDRDDVRNAYADAREFTGSTTRFLGDYTGMAARPDGFVGALPFTAPVSSVGKSQVFVADVREQAAKPRAGQSKKRRKKRRGGR